MNHAQAVDTMAAERYLLDEMTEAERHTFEEHFFSCPECADDVRAGATMADAARSGLAGAGKAALPFEAGRKRWHPSVVLPWAAAAMLAVAVGYQSLGHRDSGPLALVPTTLRPATRGAEPTVRPGPAGAITVAVVLEDGAYEQGLHYQLMHADGRVVASGDAAAPEGGAPLLLMLPAAVVRSSEQFVITVRDARSSASPAVEYRFTVGAP